jgi:hypothetical protein
MAGRNRAYVRACMLRCLSAWGGPPATAGECPAGGRPVIVAPWQAQEHLQDCGAAGRAGLRPGGAARPALLELLAPAAALYELVK